MGDVVPEALEAALAKYADPGRAYAKLRATILEACPEMDAPGQWAADTMARLVVCGIPPLPPIPEAEVLVDLAQLEIMRKSGERLDTPAGLLCHRFEKTANRHRYEWCPNGRIHQRE